ncbi:patatin-like phospholipase family protein [Candidatus Formimonas warabiya]|uniref:Patatin family protein n=1 Tax=Formimonas warabiya TaxID=1761012 RepID=A0A3G1KMH5_FORW1|nr:patatin family protein [Candidatus Formimonas warabiya]ATW23629.1 patatin family protein [Candidatus Formimonas warabiya]
MGRESNRGKHHALVVEGGAMRGIFSTGVLDAFLEKSFNPFDLFIGVSAGATNIASYLAEMYQRNLKVYTDYSIRPDFISWKKFIRGGHLIDLDWLWQLTVKEIRLDLDKIFQPAKEYYIGVTEVNTGKAVYLKPEKNTLEKVLKASSSIPIFYRHFTKIDGIDFADGGMADPIPVIEAYRRDATSIVVIRSRPYSYQMRKSFFQLLSKVYLRNYPGLINTVMNRPKIYQKSLDFMRHPPKGIRIFEVNPPENFQTKRLTTNLSILKQDYRYGYQMGMELIEQWHQS